MSKIEYITGDLFKHIPTNPTNPIVIPHIVNNLKIWGSGFVIPLGNYFPKAKNEYLNMDEKHICLGNTQIIDVSNNIFIANMIAQEGICSRSTGDRKFVNDKPIRYAALCKCLSTINNSCYGFDVYAPKFGSGLAGGNWDFIEELIEEILTNVNTIKVFSLI
jgi:hypothetical protein